ncbi:Pentatricopeptide repeat-containing protein [Forsythia ovata]|uniref:Pentatricopeptide repeat-containing protein n=1 Tax=Forsythia ovata TaxID=205694 RepID=A0ABD1PUZ6_9LAMI
MTQSLIAVIHKAALRLTFDRNFDFIHNLKRFEVLDTYGNLFTRGLSSIGIKGEKLYQEEPSRLILLGKLESSLKEHQVDKAWETYKEFKRLYGFPSQFLVAGLITELSYSSDSKCLRKACDLVLSISKEKPVILHPDLMTKLALSSARAQMPVPASTILRLMLEKRSLPSLDVLRMVFLHMVRTEIGTYLASNILIEICGCSLNRNAHKSAHIELKKPDTVIFNLVLDACVRFGASLKGQQIMELMAQVGVVADAHTAIIIARIHEVNAMRDELKKFKDYIDRVPVNLLCHYQHFYDCMLSLHFKFNDINAASELILDLYKYYESNLFQGGKREPQTSCTVSIGSHNMNTGLTLHFLPQHLQKDSIYKVDSKQGLVLFKNGKLFLSNKALAKLIVGYKRCGNIGKLSKLLISIQNSWSSLEYYSLCSNVIDACIHLGWLQTAHDILDDFELEGYPISESSYTSLLAAYNNMKMFREAEALLKKMRKVGLVLNISPKMAFSSCSSESEVGRVYLKELKSTTKSDLADSIVRNIREEEKVGPSLVHEYNSSIYFFTKAKMIGDALKTYHKMQEMKIQPTACTFFHLICGYASLRMYRDITILWGDIKRSMENQNSICNRDLYELLLLNFLRGGYFERVMEVIGFMMENGMYLDKWRYKTEFLKFHRDLYRSLNVPDAKNEVQSKRIQLVAAFRKWVGIG